MRLEGCRKMNWKMATNLFVGRRGWKMVKNDLISGVFWLIFSIFVIEESCRLGLGTLQDPQPGFVTFIASMVLGALSIILLVSTKWQRSKVIEKAEMVTFSRERLPKVLFVIVSLFVYAILLPTLGFIFCTMIIIGFLLRVIEPQKWSVVICASLFVPLICYIIFNILLKAQLPEGFLAFWNLHDGVPSQRMMKIGGRLYSFVKISSVVSDTFEASISRMIDAIMAGSLDTDAISRLLWIILSLWRRSSRAWIRRLTVSSRIIITSLSYCRPFPGCRDRELPRSLPRLARMDMDEFPSEDHLSAWAGMSPGHNESAGKKKRKDDPRQ